MNTQLAEAAIFAPDFPPRVDQYNMISCNFIGHKAVNYVDKRSYNLVEYPGQWWEHLATWNNANIGLFPEYIPKQYPPFVIAKGDG